MKIDRIHDIRIRISQLSNGIHEYHLLVNPFDVQLSENFQQSIEVDAVLEKTSDKIILEAYINTKGIFQCDRCIDDFEYPISGKIRTCYVYNKHDINQYIDDEVHLIHDDTMYIDLSDDIRDFVTLAVPLKLLCKEDCLGLCPICGIQRNYETCSCIQEEISPDW